MSSPPRVVLVDMHAEATSEKQAIAWYLDGRVSAVVGTHTHVPTADPRVLPKGTGFVTDLGMTGPYNSIIGSTIDTVIEKFLTQMPNRGSVPGGPVMMNSVLIDVDRETGKAKSVERVDRMVD
jgi:calcineurin-like phosphoesterase